jgi:hypothetical protein
MKINESKLRKMVRDILLEYEQYVDEEGNVYDDEGNVSRRGSKFGQKYGGETYTGTSPPWGGGGGRKRGNLGGGQRISFLDQIGKALELKPNSKFLLSLEDQVTNDYRPSGKQLNILRKIQKELGLE